MDSVPTRFPIDQPVDLAEVDDAKLDVAASG